jgi:hypothetical protein
MCTVQAENIGVISGLMFLLGILKINVSLDAHRIPVEKLIVS